MRTFVLLIAFVFFLPTLQAENEEGDDWGSDWEEVKDYEFSHELSYGIGTLLKDDSNRESSVLNEFRLVSRYSHEFNSLKLAVEGELINDFLLNDTSYNLTEASILIPFDAGVDFKIGRQVITWGTGDLLFLNDLFPKSWQSFFNGRKDDHLKPEIDAIRLSYYGSKLNLDLAFMPEFQPDESLDGSRYSFYYPNGITNINQPEKPFELKETDKREISARFFGLVDSLEWSVYYYDGFFKSPSHYQLDGTLSYSEMSSMGLSFRVPTLIGLLNFEYSNYESENDKDGTNPLIKNSQSRFLLGLEKELMPELMLGLQFYLESTHDYQKLVENRLPTQIIPKENRTLITSRITHFALMKRLTNSIMFFHSPSDNDYFLRHKTSYKNSDSLTIYGGINVLNGRHDYTFLSQMQENSNIYFGVEYYF